MWRPIVLLNDALAKLVGHADQLPFCGSIIGERRCPITGKWMPAIQLRIHKNQVTSKVVGLNGHPSRPARLYVDRFDSRIGRWLHVYQVDISAGGASKSGCTSQMGVSTAILGICALLEDRRVLIRRQNHQTGAWNVVLRFRWSRTANRCAKLRRRRA